MVTERVKYAEITHYGVPGRWVGRHKVWMRQMEPAQRIVCNPVWAAIIDIRADLKEALDTW